MLILLPGLPPKKSPHQIFSQSSTCWAPSGKSQEDDVIFLKRMCSLIIKSEKYLWSWIKLAQPRPIAKGGLLPGSLHYYRRWLRKWHWLETLLVLKTLYRLNLFEVEVVFGLVDHLHSFDEADAQADSERAEFVRHPRVQKRGSAGWAAQSYPWTLKKSQSLFLIHRLCPYRIAEEMQNVGFVLSSQNVDRVDWGWADRDQRGASDCAGA